MAGRRTSQNACLPNPSRPYGSNNPNSRVRLIAFILLALIVIVGLAILITWLAIKPKKIQFSVDEGWIQNYSLANGKLNSTFNFVIRAYNPNSKGSIYYDTMDVKVYYRGQTVATETIEPFFQPHKNVTRIMLQNKAQNVALQGRAVHDLKVERTGGEVDLDVKIKGKIRVKVGVWKSRHKMKVLCSPVVVNFSNHTKFRRIDCEVDNLQNLLAFSSTSPFLKLHDGASSFLPP
ncbi:hypothetical protein Cgig2_016067 [Carnegiea gigantea]|uniref:Late embryogenesis abundant protein LEA-2 subgroup domain-containing protein n=1 Tax=Carnegiea gigantea TaxID=171969 RepID=A0A9Q1GWT0_9CARY|nr:hypothetical protein Cgig2_016067 [Carnegiea gigantea]